MPTVSAPGWPWSASHMGISLVGLLGNGLIILAIARTKELHSKCPFLLAVLAAVDMGVNLSFFDYALRPLVGGSGPMVQSSCFMRQAPHLLVVSFESCLILAVGFDRLLATKYPVK